MSSTAYRQMSDGLPVGILLALSGGYMDAYTYLQHGHVFANAQTGNIILLGMNLSQGNWAAAGSYCLPVCCFGTGVLAAQLLRLHFKPRPRLHWRQAALLLEIAILGIVNCMGGVRLDWLANALVSFVCGIQVQAFRKVHGHALATTMCIGNLRTGTDLFCAFLHDHKRETLRRSLLYYFIIATFAMGAVLGHWGVEWLGQQAILVSAALLATGFIIMLHRQPCPETCGPSGQKREMK